MVERAVRESFPRSVRLTTAADFRRVFGQNVRMGDSVVTILMSRYSGENPRIGFAIAKKQIKKAVDRNKLKRIFRESFRRNQCRLPARDLVIMVRKQVLSCDGLQLSLDLEQHWNSIIKRCENC